MTDRIIRYTLPAVVLLLGAFYYLIDPEEFLLVPKCPWWLLTGTYCPSCGIQRFFHLLLNGEVISAFKANPFLGISLPYAALAILGKWYNFRHRLDPLNRVLYSRPVLITYVVFFFAWWILRNLLHI